MLKFNNPKNVFEALASSGHDEDFDPERNNLLDSEFLPTDSPPGSSERLEVFRSRVERGLPLWHKEDRNDYSGLTGIIRPKS